MGRIGRCGQERQQTRGWLPTPPVKARALPLRREGQESLRRGSLRERMKWNAARRARRVRMKPEFEAEVYLSPAVCAR